jgi:hypothetical protein
MGIFRERGYLPDYTCFSLGRQSELPVLAGQIPDRQQRDRIEEDRRKGDKGKSQDVQGGREKIRTGAAGHARHDVERQERGAGAGSDLGQHGDRADDQEFKRNIKEEKSDQRAGGRPPDLSGPAALPDLLQAGDAAVLENDIVLQGLSIHVQVSRAVFRL